MIFQKKAKKDITKVYFSREMVFLMIIEKTNLAEAEN